MMNDTSVRWTVTTGDLTTQFVGLHSACEQIATLHQEIERLKDELRVEHDIMLTKQQESDQAHAEIERLRAALEDCQKNVTQGLNRDWPGSVPMGVSQLVEKIEQLREETSKSAASYSDSLTEINRLHKRISQLEEYLDWIGWSSEYIGQAKAEMLRLRSENDALHDRLQRRERMEICEHDVPDGDWCQPCNEEEKRAREEPER